MTHPLPGEATIVAVSLSQRHGFSKQPQPAIRMLAGLGVEGDAHCGATVQHLYLKRRNPSALNLMQVHLLQSELFDELSTAGHIVGPGELGENVTTRGIDLLALPVGTHLHLGEEAVVELTGLRTPCSQIDRFQSGLLGRLVDRTLPPRRRGRAGVMATVLHTGTCQPGDEVTLQLPPGALRPLLHL